MRLRSITFALLSVALTGLVIGCGKKVPPPDPIPKPGTVPEKTSANTDVGAVLYPAAAAPVYPAIGRNAEIVISNALGQFENRQVISAEVDGTIELVATPVVQGDKTPVDQYLYLRSDAARQPYRKINDGEEVRDGQILTVLDKRQIQAKLEGAKDVKSSAEAALKKASEGRDAAKKSMDLIDLQVKSGSGAVKDLLEAKLTLARFEENEAQSQQTIARAKADMAEAEVLLGRHEVKSRVNGIIRGISKRPGEYAKAGEKIMEIEATDVVRIEGQLDVQYAGLVENAKKNNWPVTIEPAVSAAAVAEHTGHRQPVTGIAVVYVESGDKELPSIPLVVSVGADGGALVWEPNRAGRAGRPMVPHNLPHPVGVRSVAVTPPTTRVPLVITGADDGKVRVWDVTNPNRLPDKPKAEPEDAHASSVYAVAVSPKGDYFATAAGRDVFVWKLDGAKKLYALPTEHRDNVTAVSFTPQNTLITASKDGTIKVWKLGTERAAVLRTLDHRAGAVENLGVSRDGSRVLFDQDKSRIDLVDPANGQTVGQLQNVSSAGSFATLALFSSDEVAPNTPADQLPPYRILTAGGDGDLKGALQFWHAPRTGGRGAEKGRLITPGRAAVTAAAFDPSRDPKFIVVGTAAGGVYLWEPEETADRKPRAGRIANIDATDTRYVTVRVEMDNRELKLRDKNTFTVIIPTKAPAKP